MALIEPFTTSNLSRVAELTRRAIHAGGIVAVPTETYYGLGVNPFDPCATDRLCELKGRPEGKPLLVLLGDRSQLSGLVSAISPVADLLMDVFWPGPLTILFPAHPSLPPSVTAGTGTVGVRVSGADLLRRILSQVGPLTGTSANRSGCPPAETAQEVQEAVGAELALILDAGRTPGGLPSTVIDAGETVRVIREGAVPRQRLENVLQTRGISLVQADE